MSMTHKKIPYLRRARRTLLSQDMGKKERRKSIYSTCKENYKKRKKVLAIYGKILYSIYLSAVRQTPHDDAGRRKASQCFMDFKKEIQKKLLTRTSSCDMIYKLSPMRMTARNEPWELNIDWQMCGSSHFSDATESLRENEAKKQELVFSRAKRFFKIILFWRVWSWLRTNAGGVLNTCKSNGELISVSS